MAGEQREPRHVNIIQAADLLGVSRRTIYNWLRSGFLQRVKTPYGKLITVESLTTVTKAPQGRKAGDAGR